MFNTDERKERVLLVAVHEGDGTEEYLDELSLLADTAGAEDVGRVLQKREARHPGHYLGKGKLDEVRALADETGADAVVADDELSASQQRNMAERLGIKVLDRTMLILDIFAQRALTAEGKAQVELAQLKYRLSHLAGIGINLSRQAGTASHGGVGNRGPGEKKLETDRRHIRNRIDQLSRELKEIRENRNLHRKKRERAGIPVVALVGYTNAGKSTLMNALTSAGVLAEDKLFATLDTTTRKTELPGGSEILFTDTVGFISKLPHHLIQAFRATLEELKYADILLHVVDFSSENAREQMTIVLETLAELECADKPIITVLNKADIAKSPQERDTPAPDQAVQNTVSISALTGENLPKLLESVESVLLSLRSKLTVLLPYDKGSLLSQIYSSCKIIVNENREDGTYLEVYATQEIAGKVHEYILRE